MSLKTEALKKFLKAAKSLANQGLSKEAIMRFAKQEFGEITELFQKQIDNIFKREASGIEKIKIKDNLFDDTVIKLPIDDTGAPFNPKDPMKKYGKPKISIEERMDIIEETSKKLDDIMKERKETFKPKKTDDFNLSEDDPLGDLEKIIKGEGDTGLPKKPRDEKYTGGLVDVEPSLSDIGHGADALMARTRLISPGAQGTTSTGLNYLLAEDNDNIRIPFENGKNFDMYLKERGEIERKENFDRLYKEYLEDLRRKVVMKQKQEAAEGGRIGFSNGNGVADEEAANARFAKRVRQLMDEEGFDMGEAVREAMKEGYAEGGRIGFSKGKLADAARRKFMKAAGAGAAGLAALKTGLINLAQDAGPKIEAVKETVTGAPDYFFDLVSKIKMFGKKSKIGPQERVDEYSYQGVNGDDYTLTEDIVTGDARIVKDKTGGVRVGEDEVVDGVANRSVMEYKSGKGMADEGTGGTLADEYDEYEVKFDMDGTEADADDMSEFIKKEIIEEASKKITKKASGGLANLLGE